MSNPSDTESLEAGDKLPPIWNIRASRVIPYIDTDNIVPALRENLENNPSVIIKGNQQGTGASALALEYAYAYSQSYQAVWWIQGNSSASAYLDALQLLKALDIVEGNVKDVFYPLSSFKECLSKHNGWLLIIEDPASVEIIKNLIPETSIGNTIIINPADEEIQCDSIIDVGLPDKDGALQFLHPGQGDGESAADLVKLLKSSPLLLRLVERIKHVTERSYVSIQADLPPYLLNEEELHTTISLRLLLSMSLEYLSSNHKISRDLLALCAFLGPHHLPLSVFKTGGSVLSPRLSAAVLADDSFQEVLSPLIQLELVTIEENAISMNPAIQAAVREGMSEDPRKAWCNAAVNMLSESFPQEASYSEPNIQCARLIPHILNTCRYAEEIGVAPGTASSLYYQAGLYLHACSLLPEASDCYMRSIALVEEHFGTVHPAVATRINNLGIVEHELGNLDSAQACFERAMDICERLYGPTEQAMYTQIPESLLTMPLRNLCTVLEDKGDVALAQKEYERAMKTFVEVYGWNHSMVAECAYYFGNTWMKIGQLNKAQNCYIKAVRSEENAAECNNESLANYLYSLGMVLMRLSNATLAEEQFLRALRLEQQLYGNAHINTCRGIVNLGHLNKHLKKYDEAESRYNEALVIFEKNEQNKSIEAAQVLNNLGSVLIGKNQASEARTCLEQALAIIAEVNGDDSSSNISVLTNLGRALDKLEAYHQALNSYETAEKILDSQPKESLGEKATLLYRRGLTHQTINELDEALKLFEQAQNLDTQAFGNRHPAVARDAYCIGCVLKEQGETIVAMGHMSLALDIYESHFGKDYPKSIMVRKKLDQMSNNR